MNIVVETPAKEARNLKPASLERLRFALRRLGGAVSKARLTFTDANGPRGGTDKHCQVQIHLEPHGVVVVNARATNWRQALDQAIQRAVQLVVRRLKLQKRPRRIAIKRLPLAAAL
jgi:hypothetical protein